MLITTVSGIHVVTMGEYVLGMLLAFAHRLPLMMADKAEASWPENRWERYLPDARAIMASDWTSELKSSSGCPERLR